MKRTILQKVQYLIQERDHERAVAENLLGHRRLSLTAQILVQLHHANGERLGLGQDKRIGHGHCSFQSLRKLYHTLITYYLLLLTSHFCPPPLPAVRLGLRLEVRSQR